MLLISDTLSGETAVFPDEILLQAQRPASFIWSSDFQREDARVVVITLIPL